MEYVYETKQVRTSPEFDSLTELILRHNIYSLNEISNYSSLTARKIEELIKNEDPSGLLIKLRYQPSMKAGTGILIQEAFCQITPRYKVLLKSAGKDISVLNPQKTGALGAVA